MAVVAHRGSMVLVGLHSKADNLKRWETKRRWQEQHGGAWGLGLWLLYPPPDSISLSIKWSDPRWVMKHQALHKSHLLKHSQSPVPDSLHFRDAKRDIQREEVTYPY